MIGLYIVNYPPSNSFQPINSHYGLGDIFANIDKVIGSAPTDQPTHIEPGEFHALRWTSKALQSFVANELDF